MAATIQGVTYPVSELDQAKVIFGAVLGVYPVMDELYYVQFDVVGQAIGLALNGGGKGLPGPNPYRSTDFLAVSPEAQWGRPNPPEPR